MSLLLAAHYFPERTLDYDTADLWLDLVDRFWSFVDRDEDERCWPWSGRLDVDGYGEFSIAHGTKKRAHRISWEIENGKPLAELVARHTCNNPKCVNPHHLIPGTQLENVADREREGRTARGEASGRAKLGDADVAAIRADLERGLGAAELAHKFGVSVKTINKIRRGEYRVESATAPHA